MLSGKYRSTSINWNAQNGLAPTTAELRGACAFFTGWPEFPRDPEGWGERRGGEGSDRGRVPALLPPPPPPPCVSPGPGRRRRERIVWGGGSIMASMQKRLQKELLALQNDPPAGMTLNEKSVQNSITQWIIDMEGASGTLYEGEKFQLLFKFSSRYPFDSPQVVFTGENIPVHPHVYSNGHICLSILTEDWSPALSVQSVCLSIISMLSSCKEKRRPPDNSFYVRTCNKNPKKTKWWYHDDTC
ncbi:ubiquitin-conjugating enzyme E2 W [Crotalus adamanteus]|uniref:N-terminal E2 ubiquitin-conjugating enzyme n=3 Tax=Crotalinae TaxID=8710 RepID=A0AAW1BMG4_CROAD